MAQNHNRGGSWNRSNSVIKPNLTGVTAGNPLPQGLKIGVDPAPDYIFKNRRNRTTPAINVIQEEGNTTYIPYEVKYIKGEGNFVYYYGVPFPSKTIAPYEAIYAISFPKRLTINIFRFLATIKVKDFFTRKGRGNLLTNALKYYNDIVDKLLDDWYLEGYYSRPIKEIQKGIQTFLICLGVDVMVAIKTGEIIGCYFEFDEAYRWRFQDLAGETTSERLLENLPKELNRLLDIQKGREAEGGITGKQSGADFIERLRSSLKLVKYVWYLPSFKKAAREAIKVINLENCKMDEADIYHTCLYGSYNFKGRTLEERMKILEGYHGTDLTKWPVRMTLKKKI